MSCGLVLKCVAALQATACLSYARQGTTSHSPLSRCVVNAMQGPTNPARPVRVRPVRCWHLRLLNWSKSVSAVRGVRGQHRRARLLLGRQHGGQFRLCVRGGLLPVQRLRAVPRPYHVSPGERGGRVVPVPGRVRVQLHQDPHNHAVPQLQQHAGAHHSCRFIELARDRSRRPGSGGPSREHPGRGHHTRQPPQATAGRHSPSHPHHPPRQPCQGIHLPPLVDPGVARCVWGGGWGGGCAKLASVFGIYVCFCNRVNNEIETEI